MIGQSGLGSGEIQLDYLVWDGESTDGTVQAALNAIGSWGRVVSRKDTGMYDALAQGFQLVEGDVYFYLNAGDLLLPGALMTLRRLFETTKADWITGLDVYFSKNGTMISSRMPLRFKVNLIRKGAYGRILPAIQQESTFWSRELMNTVNFDALRQFRLAGDYFLWWTFAQSCAPTLVQAGLGGFSYHGDHLSEHKNEYSQEVRGVAGRLTLPTRALALIEMFAWKIPRRFTAKLQAEIWMYDKANDTWVQNASE